MREKRRKLAAPPSEPIVKPRKRRNGASGLRTTGTRSRPAGVLAGIYNGQDFAYIVKFQSGYQDFYAPCDISVA
jgi:hypothetical protein